MTIRRTIFAVAAAAALLAPGLAAAAGRADTRARMDAIFAALSTALNLTLYDVPFENDTTRDMITEALAVLADNVAALEAHEDELGPGYAHLRRSLARDAREAVLRYRQERYAGARFLLGQLTSSCVACHSKLPSTKEFDLGRAFIDRARIEDIPSRQLARLMVATRQFDRALDAYEELFRSDDTPPHELASSGALTEYLKVCLCVLEDRERACRALQSLRRRRDVTGYMESQLAAWVDVISHFEYERGGMATARSLIHEARQSSAFPADLHGLAHFVLASGCLHRHLIDDPEGAELPEVYYLLGVCEAHMATSPWVSEAEFYLESAIHADPASRFAALAVDFLEAYTAEQYRGSGGVVVPEEAQARIDSLRTLVTPSGRRR